MRISQEADYALRIVFYLSNQDPNGKFDVKQIADKISLPHRFAVKILRKLTLAGITKSFRGAYGGYNLDRPGNEISFLKVIETIDGEIFINKCLSDPENCNDDRQGYCYVRNKLLGVNKMIINELDGITFDDAKKS